MEDCKYSIMIKELKQDVSVEIFVKWRYASDIRRGAVVGRLILPHLYGIVIGGKSKIGDNCHIS